MLSHLWTVISIKSGFKLLHCVISTIWLIRFVHVQKTTEIFYGRNCSYPAVSTISGATGLRLCRSTNSIPTLAIDSRQQHAACLPNQC